MQSVFRGLFNPPSKLFSSIPTTSQTSKMNFRNAAIQFNDFHPPKPTWGKGLNLRTTIALELDRLGMNYSKAALEFINGGATAIVVDTKDPGQAVEIANFLHSQSLNESPHVIIDGHLGVAIDTKATGYLANSIKDLADAKEQLGDGTTIGLKAVNSSDLKAEAAYKFIGWIFDGKPVDYETVKQLKREHPDTRLVVTLPEGHGYGKFGIFAKLLGPNDGLAVAHHPFPEEDGPEGIARMLTEAHLHGTRDHH
ncbi:MAG: hypothetical protein Q8K75_03365 [Chlamydiales bacterium]|nr:hypothetical protein [Chlamydiales bacterium]